MSTFGKIVLGWFLGIWTLQACMTFDPYCREYFIKVTDIDT